MEPFVAQLDLGTGALNLFSERTVRKLSDLRGLVFDDSALHSEISREDRVVYEVFKMNVPEIQGHLYFSVTVLYPGKIGREYFFTKGHYHINEGAAEIYVVLRGRGILLMKKEEDVRTVELARGVVAYIPPGWGHRTINVSDEPLVFISVYPADAGHDYERFRREGMRKRVFAAQNDKGFEVVGD